MVYLHAIDIVIIVIYLLAIVLVGLAAGHMESSKKVFQKFLALFRKNKIDEQQQIHSSALNNTIEATNIASSEKPSSIDSYFLGNRQIPFWALAASGMASNLDISGTMINVALIYSFGLKGALIELRGGLTLALCFCFIIGRYYRRSHVATTAEWMTLRFGNKFEGKFARFCTSISILLLSIGGITYFTIGSGKFISQLFHIPSFLSIKGEFWASLVMIAMALIYTVASGLKGVVYTDFFQGFIIFVAIIAVCILSMVQVTLPQIITLSAPLKDGTFYQYDMFLQSWKNPVPNKWTLDFDPHSTYEVYNLFFVALGFFFIKMLIEGFGGTTEYAAQRYYAARTENEVGKLTGLWILLLSFRWPFIVCVALLGIYFGNGYGGTVIADPELVLPTVLTEMMPIGLKGLLISALLSAGMSTFDSAVNNASLIWTKDIYQAILHPNASNLILQINGWVSSIVIVAIGVCGALIFNSINEIWGFITVSLAGGSLVPLMLRWYYYRINGFGFGVGCILGAFSSLILKLVFKFTSVDLAEYYMFAIVCAISAVACVVTSFATPRTDETVLLDFYEKVKPMGYWKPVKDKVIDFRGVERSKLFKEHALDFATILIALPWQFLLYFVLIFLVLQEWLAFSVVTVLVIQLSILLYAIYFRRVGNHKDSSLYESSVAEYMESAHTNFSASTERELEEVVTMKDHEKEPSSVIMSEEMLSSSQQQKLDTKEMKQELLSQNA